MIFINEKISIIEKKISYKAIKSSGPGGQNINKVSTGIHLQYNFQRIQNHQILQYSLNFPPV